METLSGRKHLKEAVMILHFQSFKLQMEDMLSPGTLGQMMEMCQENTVIKLNKNRNVIWQKDR